MRVFWHVEIISVIASVEAVKSKSAAFKANLTKPSRIERRVLLRVLIIWFVDLKWRKMVVANTGVAL